MKTIYPLLLLAITMLPLNLYPTNKSSEIEKWLEKSFKVQYSAPKMAIFYAQKVIDMTCENEKCDLRAEALYSLSQSEKLLGNFDTSINYLYDALDFVTPSNKILAGRIYSMIGMLYCSLSDFRKAIEFNDRAASIFKSESDSLSLAMCYNDRGIIHCYLEEFSIAEQFLKQSLAINRDKRSIKRVAANLNNLCLYEGNLPEQIEYIKEAIVINKNLDSKWSLGENYNNLGRLYFYAKEYKLAEMALKEAYNIAYKVGAKELICDNYEYSSWLYHAMGSYDKAYKYLLKLHVLNKELQSSHKLRTIEQDILHKKQLKERQEAELREQGYKIELLRRNIYILIVIFILITLVILFISRWNKRKKNLELISARYDLEQTERKLAELKVEQQSIELQSTQVALENSRQEATSFAIFLQSRNEVLDKIREQIKEGYKMDSSQVVPHLKKVNSFITQHQNCEKSNKTFLLNIEEKNQEFLKRLTHKHQNLTQGEKTLATFLRVNLSSKDIAIITGTTPKSINMNRYRLRKALEIPTEEDLCKYLQNI